MGGVLAGIGMLGPILRIQDSRQQLVEVLLDYRPNSADPAVGSHFCRSIEF
jgi:hypothetical protein